MTKEEKLEEAKRLYKTANADQKYVLESLFPELKESDDERMIQYFKDLAPFDKADELYEKYGFSHKDAIAWLEKRVEQKSAEWSEEDEEIHRKCICAMRASACGFPEEEKFVEQVDNWLESLKGRVQLQQKQEWSEGDKAVLDALIRKLEGEDIYVSPYLAVECLKSLKYRVQTYSQKPVEWSEEDENLLKLSLENLTELKDRFGNEYGKVGDCIVWLKSLKDRYTWKPSDEQMDTLEYYMHTLICNEHKEVLFGLYADLKKLKE